MALITQYRQKGIIFIVVPNERKISRFAFIKSRTCLRVLGKLLMENSHSENSNPSIFPLANPPGKLPPEKFPPESLL